MLLPTKSFIISEQSDFRGFFVVVVLNQEFC